jgi:hypothetical protein
MVTGHRKIGRKFLALQCSTKSSESMKIKKTRKIKEEAALAEGEVTNESQTSPYTACIMRMTQITSQKIVPSIWKPKEK